MQNHAMRVAACAAALILSAPSAAQDEPTEVATTLAPVEVTGERDDEPPYLAEEASTATKTGTPILETPASVSVITAEALRDRGALTLQDALRYSAGIMSDAYGLDNRTDSAILRGTEFQSVVDGMRDQFNYYNTTRPDVYAFERIEILRGPASVLYGQGPSAGIVALVSKRPRAEAAHELIAEYGRFDRRRINVDSTGPIDGDGEWRYRTVGVLQRSDSQVDYAFYDREMLSPSLSWVPTDRFTWTLLTHYQRDDSRNAISFLPHSGTLLDNPNGRIPVSRFTSEPDFDRFEATRHAASSFIDWQIADTWSLHQSLRFAVNDNPYYTLYPDVFSNPQDPFLDDTRRTVARFVYAELRDQRDWTADHRAVARFATGAVAHQLLVGVDHAYSRFTRRSGSAYLDAPFDLFDPAYGTPVEMPELSDPFTTRARYTGVYAQNQMRIGNWIALGGLRHDRSGVEPQGGEEARENETTGRAGLMYETDFGLAPYLSYATSFQPNTDVDPDSGEVFDPLAGKQIEIGLKYQPDGGDTLLTLTWFDLTEENRVFYDLASFVPSVSDVDSRGVEFEGITRLGDLDLTASYTYIDIAKRRQYFAVQPRHLASLWATYDWRGLKIGAGTRYLGSTTDDGGTLRLPAVLLFDAMLAYDVERWRVAVNATNIEDQTYVTSCLARGDCFYGNRGNVVGSVGYRF
ncbi:TonB-dependent siderophore receptor [Sinimarinibacterium thermocellulolyticum]|uniref:TonB-dependent siderophore receptor n=1 Tax=Sinimarinibacterium thermocellulolyticum TaxID=3170016 RepID=A0ABV2A958_9GAMM